MQKTAGKFSINLTLFILFLLSILLFGCQSTNAAPTQGLSTTSVSATNGSPNDGATLLQTRCTVCHNLDRVENEKNSRAQWERIVNKMVQKGAELNDSEKSTLIDYLSHNYGQ